MRPIKFRGRDLDSGEYVFFNLEDILLDVAGSYSEYVGLHNIDPYSVAQLVGYDVDGKEVYEGDTVAFFYEGDTLKGTRREWTAVLVPDIVNEKIQDVRPAAFNRLTLKEV